MRVLLISDTHGHIDQLNELIDQVGADAVIHAGDFGFFDEGSVERLTDRELALHIFHSGHPVELAKRVVEAGRAAMQDLVRCQLPLSELDQYLIGDKRLSAPVYAVWGNHEDIEVIRSFREGRYRVDHLTLLDETRLAAVGQLCVFGVGGNLLPGKKIFQNPVAGGSGRVWATLSQYAQLHRRLKEDTGSYAARVFVSHVSPGKEPILRRIAAHLEADFIVSGHMGTPYCCVWSEFAIRTVEQAEQWLDVDVDSIRAVWRSEKSRRRRDRDGIELIEAGLELLDTPPGGAGCVEKGSSRPAWYRGTFSINLPDADKGYAVLAFEDGQVSLETHSKGSRFALDGSELPREE